MRLTKFTHELLDRHGILHWLDYGALLGAVRDGHLVPWDEDVDIGILATDRDAVMSLVPEIERAGYRVDTTNPYVVRINLSAVNTQHVDLFPWEDDGGTLRLNWPPEALDWLGMKDTAGFPISYIEQLDTVLLEGYGLPAPLPVERFLVEHRYGADFRTPMRPVIYRTFYADARPEELTPLLVKLYDAIALKEAELLAQERRRLGRLLGLDVFRRWAESGRPTTPAPERLARVRGEWDSCGDGPLVERSLESLATLEQAIDELASPSARTRITRIARRGQKLARRSRDSVRRSRAQ